MQKKVSVSGAGKIGKLVTHMLAYSEDYCVTVVDSSKAAAEIATKNQITGKHLPHTDFAVASFSDKKEIEQVLIGKDYVLSCAPFYCNVDIAKVAKKCRVNYLDLTEDVRTTSIIKELARDAQSAFIPQCGLAPGFITIVTNHLAKQFDKVEDVKMRVGALPMYPHNRLKYNLTWSVEGLINEYCNPCEVIEDGKMLLVPAMEGHEVLSIDGEEYEAFNTSGGLGTLAESLTGKVRTMNYKTMRYPGHREILCTLLHDLKFIDDRDGLRKIFERSLPHTFQDVVIIFVTVTGYKNGKFTQETYAKKVYHADIANERWGAIQITTAAGICTVLDLHAHGKLAATGFVRQENICYDNFVKNRFGKYYD